MKFASLPASSEPVGAWHYALVYGTAPLRRAMALTAAKTCRERRAALADFLFFWITGAVERANNHAVQEQYSYQHKR